MNATLTMTMPNCPIMPGYDFLGLDTRTDEAATNTIDITREASQKMDASVILTELVKFVLDRANQILNEENIGYKNKIYLTNDPEVPGWEEFVISLLINEDSFEKRMLLWDKFESSISDFFCQKKRQKFLAGEDIDTIDRNFVFNIKRL